MQSNEIITENTNAFTSGVSLSAHSIYETIPYTSSLGWEIEKRISELQLRRELGIQNKLIKWFLDKSIETDNVLFFRITARLVEIEIEAKSKPVLKIVNERDTFAPYPCEKCGRINLCDEMLYGFRPGQLNGSRGNYMKKHIDIKIPVAKVKELLNDNGYVISFEDKINYGYQISVTTGAIINIYSTGMVAMQEKKDTGLSLLLGIR